MAERTVERAPKRLTRKEKQAQTRERLLDAAERVFLRRGLQGSSVEEITDEAGYTRGAFYSNFKTKEELFVELLQDRVYRQYAAMAVEAQAQPGSPRERLRWGIEQLKARYENEDGTWLFRLWLELLTRATRDEEFRKLAATFWSGNRKLLTEQAKEIFEEVAREPPIPAKQIATAMIALDIGLAVQHLVDPDEAPLEDYVPVFDLLIGRLADAGSEE